jgi:hypothetical protein
LVVGIKDGCLSLELLVNKSPFLPMCIVMLIGSMCSVP